MTNTRTLLSTAMALSLAGCATSSSSPEPSLTDLPRAYQSDVQLASMQNQLSRVDVPQPVMPAGQVVLTRTEEAQPGPTTEDVQKELREATARAVAEARDAADKAVAKAKQEAMAELDDRFRNLSGQTNLLLNQTTEVLRANTAATTAAKQTAEMKEQLNQVTATAVAKAKQEALAELDTRFRNLSGQTNRLLDQTTEVLRANTAATTAAKQSAEVKEQLSLATAMAVAQARQEAITQARREAADAVAKAKQEAIAEVENRFQSLSGQTDKLLSQTNSLLSTNAQVLVNSNRVLAANTVAQQSLARQQLQTWKQGEELKLANKQQLSSIRADVSETLANIGQNPTVQTALRNAAQDVITKDDRVVFAIRKVVGEQLASAGTLPADAGTPVSDTAVPTATLTIGQLQGPGSGLPLNLASLAAISPAAGPARQLASATPPANALRPARLRKDWIDLRKYHVVVHEDSKTLEELMNEILTRAVPFTGPWHIKWKISDENKDILQERFSLDVETSFDEFVGYLAQYMVNDRGIKITFSLFDADRIIVVSD